MTRRRYGQFCPLAKALDLLGERWTLLVVRELLGGPKRYTDIREGLPGLATDLLATRLRELQHAGIVTRRDVPPPTPATIYELTERGVGLRPVIRELSAWGLPLLREPSDDHVPESALTLGLQAAFRGDAATDIDEAYGLDVDGVHVTARVKRGRLKIEAGIADDVSVRIVTDRRGFMDLARGHPSSRLKTHGDKAALHRVLKAFSIG